MSSTRSRILGTVVRCVAMTLVVVWMAACSGSDQAVDPGVLAPSTTETTQAAPSTMAETAPSTATTAPKPTTTSTTTSTTQPTTTTVETTTTSPSTTNTAPQETAAVGLLVSHVNGIDLRPGEDIVVVLEGVATSAAFADGLGGVVYQPAISGHRPGWDWWMDLPQPSLVWHNGGPIEHPIMWIPSLGSPPQVLVADDEETWIELVDVTTLRDRPVVVYEREVALLDSCVGLDDLTHCYFESMRTRLTARDLETGQEWSLGRSGSFEWSARASIAGSRAAVNFSNLDHCGPAEMHQVDISAMLALDRDAPITSATSDEVTTIGLDDPCATDESCENPGCAGLSVPALSRDGSSLAFVEYYHNCCGRPSNDAELVVRDLDEGREILRTHLGQDQWATWIDHNGAETLVGLSDNSAILVDADGVTTTLPPGPRYSFWDQ